MSKQNLLDAKKRFGLYKDLFDAVEPVEDEVDFKLKNPKAWEEKNPLDTTEPPIEKTSMFQSDMDAHIYSFDNNF